MSRNSSDKKDFNYQQELLRFLHTGCTRIPADCQIMAVEKSNSILEARYGGKLGEICNIFYPHVPFPLFL